MSDTLTAQIIQNWLNNQVKIPLSDKPLFRLAWSEDLYEVRKSLFPIYDSIGRKIGESERFGLAKKYNFITDRWIIEQWLPPEIVEDENIAGTDKGDYFCIFVFEDNTGKKLPLNLAVAQLLVRHALKPRSSYSKRLIDKIQLLKDKEKEADRIVMDCLNDEGPLVSQFHDGTAILNNFDKNAKD